MQLEPYAQTTKPCTVAPFIVDEAFVVLKRIFTGVAVLVAVVTTHPTVIVEVAVVEVVPFETTIVPPVAAAPTVKLPASERAPAEVVVAIPFTMKLPATDIGPVVEAFTNDERPVTPSWG